MLEALSWATHMIIGGTCSFLGSQYGGPLAVLLRPGGDRRLTLALGAAGGAVACVGIAIFLVLLPRLLY